MCFRLTLKRSFDIRKAFSQMVGFISKSEERRIAKKKAIRRARRRQFQNKGKKR